MFKRLISLEWKSFFRSASVGKSIGLKILMGFLGVYFILIFLLFGIGLYPLVKDYYPQEVPLQVVNGYVLLWLLVELAYRFILQSLPILEITPLLILPIKKIKIIDFVLIKSLFSFFNFLPLLIIIPFGLFNIYRDQFATGPVVTWMIAMTGLTLSVNYSNFIIKKKFAENVKALLPLVVIFIGFALLEYFEIFKVRLWFGKGLDQILLKPWLVIVPILLFLLLFLWNRFNLRNKFYLDVSLGGNTRSINTREFLWTRKFGDLAPFLQQDLKLIWRNKRPKTAIYMSILFLGYGLLFYTQDTYLNMPWLFVFVGIFITGIFMINFGQFIPAWDSNYYALIMAQNVSMNRYLTAKAGLITFSVIVLAVLSTPYAYFGWDIFLLNIICAVYNIGINIPILLYAGSFNRKRIDLDKGQFMNYQGTGAAQWLVGIPLLVFPVFLFWVFYKITSYESAMVLLLGIGVFGILIKKNLIDTIAVIYKQKKYQMIEGFKEKGD